MKYCRIILSEGPTFGLHWFSSSNCSNSDAFIFIPVKFECLNGAASSSRTDKDMDAAWSRLSTAEIQELVGGGRNGEEGGKTLVYRYREISPLHQAAYQGNSISLTYLLVSIRVAKSEGSFMIRPLINAMPPPLKPKRYK